MADDNFKQLYEKVDKVRHKLNDLAVKINWDSRNNITVLSECNDLILELVREVEKKQKIIKVLREKANNIKESASDSAE